MQSKINDTSVESALMNCKFCKKNFSVSNINAHLAICKKKKKNIEEEQKNYIETLKNEFQSVIEKLQIENNDLKEYIIKIEAENTIYKRDHETITSIAKQPKITTNNTYNLSVYDDNLIKDRFMLAINNIKPSDLYDGQKSLGRFVAPCLKNDDGTTMVSCTDSSRGVFVYKDSDGNLNKDIKCRNLANLIEPIATAKVDELIKDDNDKRYKISKISSLKKQIIDRRAQIESLNEHILGFRKDTSKWNQVRSQILRKESENERDIEMLENLENDQDIEIEDHLPPLDCDEKLVVAADDIKEMKKDSSKFSKTISELVV